MTTNNTINQLAAFALEIRRLTLKRLEEVPEGFINWRLNNTAMSFAHLVKHIMDVDVLFFSLATRHTTTFTWEMGSEEPHVEVDEAAYRIMLETLAEYGRKRHAMLLGLNDRALHELIQDAQGQDMTLWWFVMHHVLEHETYHRGQIAAYLKVLKGER